MKHVLLLASFVVFTFVVKAGEKEESNPIKTPLLVPNFSLLNPTLSLPYTSFGSELTLNLTKPYDIERRRRRRGRKGSFSQGASVLSIGYGLPNVDKILVKSDAEFQAAATWLFSDDLMPPEVTTKGFGPIFAKYEYGVADKIGVGGTVRFSSASAEFEPTYDVGYFNDSTGEQVDSTTSYLYTYKRTNFSIMGRFNFHFLNGRSIDPYVGLGIGYSASNVKVDDSDDPYSFATLTIPSITPIAFELTTGIRFYFSDIVGAYIELGWSRSYANFGMSFKFQ